MSFGVEVVRDRSAILRAIVLFSRSRTFSSRELATSSVKPARAHFRVYPFISSRYVYLGDKGHEGVSHSRNESWPGIPTAHEVER